MPHVEDFMSSPTWIVQLFIDGPVAVPATLTFQQPKGFNRRRQFYSDVSTRNIPSGLRMSVTAYAREGGPARKAALVFVGETLDVLATDLKLPLRVSLYDPRSAAADGHTVKRVVTREEIERAFGRARWLAEYEPTFLRALSWFRKGLTTEDPLDRFMAFWLSLEIVAGKYHPDVPEAAKGSKSQLWECFKSIWGDIGGWPLIPGNSRWIRRELRAEK